MILLSYLICYRNPDRTDDPCNLFRVLNKFRKDIKETDYDKIEILIRIDKDDIPTLNRLVNSSYISAYPMKIRIFNFNRWEGRHTFNYHYMFLFSQRNPNSKFIGFMTDDCLFHDKIEHIIEELETKYLDLDYAVFFSCATECYPTPEIYKQFHIKTKLDFITKMGDYKTLDVTEKWSTNFLTESYPIVSCKLLEVMSNLGWQVNIDSTLGLLNIMLYQKYGVNIAFLLENKSFIRKDCNRTDKETPAPNPFNHDMVLNASKNSKNKYLYTLMEQQAKNIYLNMKEDGVLDKYLL